MNPTVIISDMVCRHCVSAVEGALHRAEIPFEAVEIGKVYLKTELTPEETAALDAELAPLGFSRVDSDEEAIVDAAKRAVMHHVRDESGCRLKLSACIESQLGMSYAAVSRLFSQHEGRTLEKYHQAQKVERVKELLQQGKRSLDEIADIVGYSSGAHLSRRFKDVTGMTPTEYIRLQPPADFTRQSMNIDEFLRTADKPAVYTLKFGPVSLPLTDSAMIREAMLACAPKQNAVEIVRSRGIVVPAGTCSSVSYRGGIVCLNMLCRDKRMDYETSMDFDSAADVLTAFYRKSEIPDCLFWDKYHVGYADDGSFELVTTDKDYRYICFGDVETALSRLDEGLISMFSLRTSGGCKGYFEVSRGDGSYLLEVTKGLEGSGFRSSCSDRDRLLAWLRDFYDDMSYPVFDDAWTEFDVEVYYKSLMEKLIGDGE